MCNYKSLNLMLLFMLMIFISFHNLTAQNFITKWSFSNSAIQLQFNALTAGDVNFTWSATPSGNSGSDQLFCWLGLVVCGLLRFLIKRRTKT